MAEEAKKHSSGKNLSHLYAQYSDELTRFVRGKFGMGPPDPEDIVHQAFTNFAEVENPERVENPRAFLYRTANNIALNHQVRNKMSARVMGHWAEDKNAENGDELTPEIVLQSKERLAVLERVIRNLPRDRQRLLVMNRIQGLSYAEVARRTGTPVSTVKKHVYLAVKECGLALDAADEQAREGEKP